MLCPDSLRPSQSRYQWSCVVRNACTGRREGGSSTARLRARCLSRSSSLAQCASCLVRAVVGGA
eukprot:1042361-Alexandrium_andersonii.AAC.1